MMGYRNLGECIRDLAAVGQLVTIEEEIDPNLEAAEIQRRVFQAGGPAIFYANVKGCQFPMVSNLFGTLDRARFIFRDTLPAIERLMKMKSDPAAVLRHPFKHLGSAISGLHALPRFVSSGPILQNETRLSCLPQVKSWPDDGGAFITLPLVYTEHPEEPGLHKSNLGMYRIQLSGGQYKKDVEAGMHYQIHRGIGVHHAAALRQGQELKVNIFIGGPPAFILSAVMPLPEGMPELYFAGTLGGRRPRLVRRLDGLPLLAEADFAITGTIDLERQLPEGPFGDHLGYYSLAHDFPVLKVDHVYHRKGAIYPFTVVGRPPQEDIVFGQLIHELTGPVIPSVIPGVKAVHAVDAAGVHPLLLAAGSERYTPHEELRRPMELLTQANAILGQGQLSLAKYLLIATGGDGENPDVHNIPAFLKYVLERVDWRRDLHFQTCTTIDTLDYSGAALNEGSKLVIAAVPPKKRDLLAAIPAGMALPPGFTNPRVCLPGILAVNGPPYSPGNDGEDSSARGFSESFEPSSAICQFPLVVIVDDSDFCARSLDNFLWVTFTRSNPAADVYGVGAFTHQKHWGCTGPLIIDARIKPHHAPPLVEDREITRRVNRLAEQGGPLHGIL